MRRAAWIAGVAAAAAVAALALLTPGSRHVKRFAYWSAPLSPSEYDALAGRPHWRARSLEVDAGVSLRGLERRPAGARAPWILYFPGNSSSLLSEAQRFLDAAIGDRDWGAVVWSYRGFDGSGGKPEAGVFAEDAWKAAADLVKSEQVSRDRIHLVGFSLGTSMVAAVSARAGEARFATATLLAPLTEIDVHPEGWWFGGHRYETLPYLAAMGGPVLVVHGSADDVLPASDAQLVAARLGDRARYVELPGVGHTQLLQDARASDLVREFVAQHMVLRQELAK
jgi:pimeloyl-ACP methyl ester carboxylesterase